MKYYSRLADAFTPLGKAMSSEFANQNTYDAIQVHGGSGYMKDYKCERLYRDARITNIYEGTTQLQVVAAIRHVTTGTYLQRIKEYETMSVIPELEPLKRSLSRMTQMYEKQVGILTSKKTRNISIFMPVVWWKVPDTLSWVIFYCRMPIEILNYSVVLPKCIFIMAK